MLTTHQAFTHSMWTPNEKYTQTLTQAGKQKNILKWNIKHRMNINILTGTHTHTHSIMWQTIHTHIICRSAQLLLHAAICIQYKHRVWTKTFCGDWYVCSARISLKLFNVIAFT